MRRWGAAVGFAAALLSSAGTASAFCGFYISGADAKLFNNATIVVLMRDGLRTVLSMQNNYEGPPEDFAMVVPVPVVLQESNVKTLPREVFTHIDQLAAPRLVEYWEQDPCSPEAKATATAAALASAAPGSRSETSGEERQRLLLQRRELGRGLPRGRRRAGRARGCPTTAATEDASMIRDDRTASPRASCAGRRCPGRISS